MVSIKRHIVKSISWRIIGTIDTFLLSYILTGSFYFGISISGIDFFSKLLLYFFHERIWFLSKIKEAKRRHLFKTLSWRFIGSSATFLIAWILTGKPFIGFKIGLVEAVCEKEIQIVAVLQVKVDLQKIHKLYCKKYRLAWEGRMPIAVIESFKKMMQKSRSAWAQL